MMTKHWNKFKYCDIAIFLSSKSMRTCLFLCYKPLSKIRLTIAMYGYYQGYEYVYNMYNL